MECEILQSRLLLVIKTVSTVAYLKHNQLPNQQNYVVTQKRDQHR